MFNFACKACGNSDKTTDTVKVSFPQVSADDKENAAPEAGQLDKLQEEQRKLEQEAEERRQREEDERLRREQEEQMRREEEERRLAAERQRAEEAERRRKELEAQKAREAEELRRRQEEEEKARRRAEEAKKQAQLGDFLAKNGFAGANEKKKKSGLISSGFTYPLHAAVRTADAQAVGLLLWAGADRSFKDSAKLTPLALAQKLDKKGSHRLVIDALSA